MRRLLSYLGPYKWQVATALTAIVLKAAADVIGPLLALVAIDLYLSPSGTVVHHGGSEKILAKLHSLFAGRLSADPITATPAAAPVAW